MSEVQKRMGLKDIAKACGLSVGTVSKVLNGQAEQYAISASTRDWVISMAKRMNYRKNLGARALRTGLYQTIMASFPMQATSRIARNNQQVDVLGFNKSLLETYHVFEGKCFSDWKMAVGFRNESKKPDPADLAMPYDGILYFMPSKHFPQHVWLARTDIPMVIIGEPSDDGLEATFVDVNNEHAGYELTKHLKGIGRSNLVFLGDKASKRSYLFRNQRIAGVERAAGEFGLNLSKVLESGLTAASGEEACEKLLRDRIPCDGIVAESGDMAYGCLKKLKEQSLHVPNDIAIVTFDTSLYTILCEPQITTWDYPHDEVCLRAAQQLIARMKDPDLPHEVIRFEGKLLLGGSTATSE